MAKECPMRKNQTFPPKPKFNTSNTPSPCKFNTWKPRNKRTFPKPTKLGPPSQSYARTASIEEVDEVPEEDKDIPALAARASQFNEGQHEQWVQEMKSLGINF